MSDEFYDACAKNDFAKVKELFYTEKPYLNLKRFKENFEQKYYCDIDCRNFFSDCIEVACFYGHLEIVKWLLTNRTEYDATEYISEALLEACRGKEVHVCMWLVNNFPKDKFDSFKIDDAFALMCEHENYNLASFLVEEFPNVRPSIAFHNLFKKDHDVVNMARWILVTFPKWKPTRDMICSCMYNATRYSSLASLQWLFRTYPEYVTVYLIDELLHYVKWNNRDFLLRIKRMLNNLA